MTIRVCDCGKEFVGLRHYMTCSPECSLARRQKRMRTWRAANPDKLRIYEKRQRDDIKRMGLQSDVHRAARLLFR